MQKGAGVDECHQFSVNGMSDVLLIDTSVDQFNIFRVVAVQGAAIIEAKQFDKPGLNVGRRVA
jgi:hypothetical protein